MNNFWKLKLYPDEDECAGVAHFVFPFWDFGHGKLWWTGALAQNLPNLQNKIEIFKDPYNM